MRKKYYTPVIKEKKVEGNFFLQSDRFFDSFDQLAPKVFAQSGCACYSCSVNTSK